MDRDEALKLLRGGPEGIKEWNRWREKGEEIPDLKKADLKEAHFEGAELYGFGIHTRDEPGESWGCSFCGNCYLAVFDEHCDPQHTSSARWL